MKIALSRISGSGDNKVEEFMKKIDDNVSLMSNTVDTRSSFEVNQGYYGPVFKGCTSFKFEPHNSKSADRT